MPEIVIPMITPFRKDEIDSYVLRRFIEYAVGNRFDGLFPGGSTGGFASLSFSMHRELLEKVIEESTGLKLYAGICRNNIRDTIELGRRAIDMGYSNLVCINPYYHKFSSRSIEHFFEIVLSELDADIYIYNNPSLSGTRLGAEMVSDLRDRFSNLVGMKDSGNDFNLFKEFLEIKGLKVFQGKDAFLAESLEAGAAGGVCSTANFSLNTRDITRNSGNIGEISAMTRNLVSIVSKYEVPAIHNYLFRKLILQEEKPSDYMNSPFVDLDPLPDIEEFRKNSILPR